MFAITTDPELLQQIIRSDTVDPFTTKLLLSLPASLGVAYEVELPNHPHKFPKFHVSDLCPYHPNNPDLFPGCEHARPTPVVTENGVEEWYIERILDQCHHGHGFQFLIKWADYPDSEASWLPRGSVDECAALGAWLIDHSEATQTKCPSV